MLWPIYGGGHAGEQSKREYNQTFNETSTMGKATPSNTQGELVAKTLKWRSGKDENRSKIVSERHRAFEAGEHRRGGETALPADSVFGHPSMFDGESVSALLTTGNDDDIPDLSESAAGEGEDRGYGNLRRHFGPFSHALPQFYTAPCGPPHRVQYTLLSAHADRALSGACNPM